MSSVLAARQISINFNAAEARNIKGRLLILKTISKKPFLRCNLDVTYLLRYLKSQIYLCDDC